MYLSGLRIGFTREDLRRMEHARLAAFIDVHNEMAAPADGGGAKEATQADIDRMLAY